jgi:uncharacterized protein YkwD
MTMAWFARFLSWFKPAPTPVPHESQVGPIEPFDEADLIARHNAERAKRNLPPLIRDGLLSTNAALRAGHAADLELTRTHLHDGLKFVIGARRTSENAEIGAASAVSVMESWMESPDHRANILDPSSTKMGAGRAVSRNGVAFWYTVFTG